MTIGVVRELYIYMPKRNINIDYLARITQKGFDDMHKHFDRIDKRLDDVSDRLKKIKLFLKKIDSHPF